jgi:cytoskeletal protein CcmA (bactofilin family)
LTTVAGSTSGRPDAFLGKGTKVVGTLNFTGSAEIDCQVEGEINAKELLTIAEAAIINGKINGVEVVIRGTVNGDIIASKKLSLRRPAKVVGNITSTNLSIEEGVVFEGKCAMTAATNTADANKTVNAKN